MHSYHADITAKMVDTFSMTTPYYCDCFSSRLLYALFYAFLRILLEKR